MTNELPPRPKLMKCGCAPTALHHRKDGTQCWCCFTHAFMPGKPEDVSALTPMPDDEVPDLTGRKARCAYYGKAVKGWCGWNGLFARQCKDGTWCVDSLHGTYHHRIALARAGCKWNRHKSGGGGWWSAPTREVAEAAGAAIAGPEDCCQSEVDSSFDLAFFKHQPEKERDEYYCGCHGWD